MGKKMGKCGNYLKGLYIASARYDKHRVWPIATGSAKTKQGALDELNYKLKEMAFSEEDIKKFVIDVYPPQ